MDLLLPNYEHQIVAGAGLSVSAGKPKFVLHTTETGYGSLQYLIDHWKQNWGSGLPHFIVEGKRCVQLLPLNVGAYTLENAPGGTDTNRSGPAVQCEVVSYADKDWDDDTYETVGKMLADTIKAGHKFDIGTYPRFYGANEGIVLASYSSPIRMSADEYTNYNGWTDHAHCPENAHWDIGKKDGKRIETIARKYLGETPVKEEDIMASIDDLKKVVDPAVKQAKDEILAAIKAATPDDGRWRATSQVENKVYLVIDSVKYHVPAELSGPLTEQFFDFLGFDNRGVQDAALGSLPEGAWEAVGVK